jgi:hypothetical protein
MVYESTPALHCAGLVLLHQAHRLDDIDDEDRAHDTRDVLYGGQNFGDHVVLPRLDLIRSIPSDRAGRFQLQRQ